MAGVSFALYDFVTRQPIGTLPVMKGATWSTQLNRPDAISCKINLRDPDVVALDPRSSTEPMKTIIAARTDDGVILAWGLIPDDGRVWDEDSRTVDLTATGIEDSYFGATVIAPPAVLTAPLNVVDAEGYTIINPALNTTVAGVSHGTIGKRLIEQRLAFPGAPEIILPPDEVGFREQSYELAQMKMIGAALGDLTKQEGGPDFAFDAAIDPDGLRIQYTLRHGSEAQPRLGAAAGVWSFGGTDSKVSGLKITDAVAAGASLGLMTAGRNSALALISRLRNTALVASGFPPFDIVDTSHSDVSLQRTLDLYNAANMKDAERTIKDLEFTVRADATPGLGQFRPGDTLELDPPEGHPWHSGSIGIRVTSITGDDAGLDMQIGCVILNGA